MRPLRRAFVRALPLAAVVLAGLSCNASHEPPFTGTFDPTTMTGPPRPAETHLRGQVIIAGTSTPVPGALVDAGAGTSVSDSLGNYNIQHLTMLATTLVTTAAGFDTARSYIPLEGGDKVFTIRMTRNATPGTP